MGLCKYCHNKGFFLSVNEHGLCKKCALVLQMQIERGIQIIKESESIINKSNNLDTRISRCNLIITHLKSMIELEQRGIATFNQSLSEMLENVTAEKENIILEGTSSSISSDNYSKSKERNSRYNKKSDYHDEIGRLLKDIESIEREAKVHKSQGGDGFYAPAFYERLAVLYRKDKRYSEEVAIIERLKSKNNYLHDKLANRLKRAKELQNKAEIHERHISGSRNNSKNILLNSTDTSIIRSVKNKALIPKRKINSHRANQRPLRCCEINMKSLTYVPLPRAPHKWEEIKRGGEPKPIKASNNNFEIYDSDDWKLFSVDKLALDDRPDPAYRRFYPITTGIIMVDDLGKSKRYGDAPSSAISFGKQGKLIETTSLFHDIYRIDVNPVGRGLIAMSSACVAHAYDDKLNCILETSLYDSPEVLALQKRLGINSSELNNHLRCISMACDNSRYMFTGVDEAWCIDLKGTGFWGLKMPSKEGWSQISKPSDVLGTSDDIKEALDLMNLSLPYTAEDLKDSYRILAKEWHPDLNPENKIAEEKMKTINNATELLTGIDQRSILSYTGARFIRDLYKETIDFGGSHATVTASIEMGYGFALDWIYATAFSVSQYNSFLASYSGKIFHINGEGQPKRAYDIGAVPRQIIDTGDYLYFLTDTRLYILKEESLVAIIDITDGGQLLMAQTGFGLIQKYSFRWFREDGSHLGTIATSNPIRRLYYIPQGMVVETRQHKAIISGIPNWWE